MWHTVYKFWRKLIFTYFLFARKCSERDNATVPFSSEENARRILACSSYHVVQEALACFDFADRGRYTLTWFRRHDTMWCLDLVSALPYRLESRYRMHRQTPKMRGRKFDCETRKAHERTKNCRKIRPRDTTGTTTRRVWRVTHNWSDRGSRNVGGWRVRPQLVPPPFCHSYVSNGSTQLSTTIVTPTVPSTRKLTPGTSCDILHSALTSFSMISPLPCQLSPATSSRVFFCFFSYILITWNAFWTIVAIFTRIGKITEKGVCAFNFIELILRV